MRKFKVKNRQKRKYTRHNVPQSSYQFSPLFAGLLPMTILAIALLATILMNMNLREQTVSFQPQMQIALPKFTLPDLITPIQSLPNLFNQPVAFVSGVLSLLAAGVISTGTAFADGFVWVVTQLDPRFAIAALGKNVQWLIGSIGFLFVAIFNGFAWAGTEIGYGLGSVGEGIAYGANVVWASITGFIISIVQALWTALVFLFNGLLQIAVFLFNGIVSILTYIGNGIMAAVNAVVRVILIPFQIIGAFWLQIKPYFDILLYHFALAGADLANGFNLLANPASILEE
jgi:hypothetical protein